MGCLPLAVTTHFCWTRGSKRWLVGTDWSTIWRWSEPHLTVLCIDEIVPSYVVVQLNGSDATLFAWLPALACYIKCACVPVTLCLKVRACTSLCLHVEINRTDLSRLLRHRTISEWTMRHQSIYTLGTSQWGQLLFGVALQFIYLFFYFWYFCSIVTVMQIQGVTFKFLQNPPIIKVVYN